MNASCSSARPQAETTIAISPPKFRRASSFAVELRRAARIDVTTAARFTGQCKGAAMLTWFVVSYVLLVFIARSWWQVFVSVLSFVLAAAGVSFNVMHDAGHGAYCRHRGVNRVMSMALDLLGGSSFIWKWKHNVLHHTYTNLVGADGDADLWPFARVSAEQPRLFAHRFQHIYMWALYGFVPLHWYAADLRFLASGHMMGRRFPRPRGGELIAFVMWKALFLVWSVLVPLLYHAPVNVLVVWLSASFALGIALAVPFQLAHCVVEADSGLSTADVDTDWIVHQVRTTANFAMSNRLLTWYLGGLNFQIEHHLFPSVPHVHYAQLSPIVQTLCRRFGIRYVAHETLGAAIRSHYRWLRRLGSLEEHSRSWPG